MHFSYLCHICLFFSTQTDIHWNRCHFWNHKQWIQCMHHKVWNSFCHRNHPCKLTSQYNSMTLKNYFVVFLQMVYLWNSMSKWPTDVTLFSYISIYTCCAVSVYFIAWFAINTVSATVEDTSTSICSIYASYNYTFIF